MKEVFDFLVSGDGGDEGGIEGKKSEDGISGKEMILQLLATIPEVANDFDYIKLLLTS